MIMRAAILLAMMCVSTVFGAGMPAFMGGSTAAVVALKNVTLAPAQYQNAVHAAFLRAGKNAQELSAALAAAEPGRREAVAFLIANMPDRDLKSVSAKFLQEHVEYAYKAWAGCPWSNAVPKQVFLQYVLPYANLNERRDSWRKDFYERFAASAWTCSTIRVASDLLDKAIGEQLGVTFHATKRPKPDQSPYESIEAKYASCTGLSILYADVCRAAGIPARIVGVPQWKSKEGGNHNWVEVFDGRWVNSGSLSLDPRTPHWVNARCMEACDATMPMHSVYASVTRQTKQHFPLIWDLSITYVPGLNITQFYLQPTNIVVDIPGGGAATVTAYWQDDIAAFARGKGSVTLPLARGEAFDIEISPADGKATRTQKKL